MGITTVGEVQVNLEAAREHMNVVWGLLDKAGLSPHRRPYTPNGTDGMTPGTIEYHFAALEEYVTACISGLVDIVGSTEGQLCPYDACAYELAFGGPGWWLCPNCDRLFYAVVSDSDTELYHNHRVGSVGVPTPPDSSLVRYARSLGPSWGSPA